MAESFKVLYGTPLSQNCRHYAMLRVSNPTSDKYQLAVNSIMNLQDFSGMIIPSIGYEGWDNITLSGNITVAFGREYSEFRLYGNVWSCGLDLELWL